MFHQLKEPFTDQKVREAFGMALDRDKWVADVLKGLGSPTLTWIPPGYPGYQEGETRWALAPTVPSRHWPSPARLGRQAAQDHRHLLRHAAQPRSQRVAGRPVERGAGRGRRAEPGRVDHLHSAHQGHHHRTADVHSRLVRRLPRPPELAERLLEDRRLWPAIAYSNPDFDALVNEADTTTDPAKRAELYAQAQDLLVAGAPVAFFWNNVNTYMIKPWVKGILTTPQDSGWAGIYSPLTIDIDTRCCRKAL